MVNIKKQIPFIVMTVFIIGIIFKMIPPNVIVTSAKKPTPTTVNNITDIDASKVDGNNELLEQKEYARKINRDNAIAAKNEQIVAQSKENAIAEEQLKDVKKVALAPIMQDKKKTQTTSVKPKATPVVTNKPISPPPVNKQDSNKYDVEYLTNIENEVIKLCNLERAKISKEPLLNNNTLRKVARFKSNEMLQHDYFAHTSSVTGLTPSALGKTFGWNSNFYGENIWSMKADIPKENNSQALTWFKGNITAKRIVEDWMSSPGHKANILKGDYNKIGVGVAFSTIGKVYSTQTFSN